MHNKKPKLPFLNLNSALKLYFHVTTTMTAASTANVDFECYLIFLPLNNLLINGKCILIPFTKGSLSDSAPTKSFCGWMNIQKLTRASI